MKTLRHKFGGFVKVASIAGILAPLLLLVTSCETPQDTALLSGVLGVASVSPAATAAQSAALQVASATAMESAKMQNQVQASEAGRSQVNVNIANSTAPAIGSGYSNNNSAPDATYEQKCLKCHGLDGSGGTIMGKKLGVRDLRRVLGFVTDEQVRSAIKNGVKDDRGMTLMKAYGELSDPTISALVSYMRERFNGGASRQGSPSVTPNVATSIQSGSVSVTGAT